MDFPRLPLQAEATADDAVDCMGARRAGPIPEASQYYRSWERWESFSRGLRVPRTVGDGRTPVAGCALNARRRTSSPGRDHQDRRLG